MYYNSYQNFYLHVYNTISCVYALQEYNVNNNITFVFTTIYMNILNFKIRKGRRWKNESNKLQTRCCVLYFSTIGVWFQITNGSLRFVLIICNRIVQTDQVFGELAIKSSFQFFYNVDHLFLFLVDWGEHCIGNVAIL